ncbi:hypothetical protein [Staphylococcus cohnii]|uniref:hypothetical protein n=1 Tax=Staphylococcus cohnii TaxID=29382 RepID=UPI003D7DAC39
MNNRKGVLFTKFLKGFIGFICINVSILGVINILKRYKKDSTTEDEDTSDKAYALIINNID